jgi:hypothetical protein
MLVFSRTTGTGCSDTSDACPLLGVRSDLRAPRGLSLRPSAALPVGCVLSDLPALRSQLSQYADGPTGWADPIRDAYARFMGADLDDSVRAVMTPCNASAQGGTGGRFVPRRKVP